MKKLILILSIFLVWSCRENQAIDPNNPILGTWIYKDYEQINPNEYATVYERKAQLEGCGGIVFKTANQLIERKNAGWCGTPPISYGDYDGRWYLNDKKITTESDGWNGKVTTRYEIISVDSNTLKLKFLN